MFDFSFGIFIFFFIVVIILVAVFSSKGSKKTLKNSPIPDNLGIQLEGVLPTAQALDHSLSNSYIERVKDRVIKEHPKWADHEFEWTLFELKRYFVMNSLLKLFPCLVLEWMIFGMRCSCLQGNMKHFLRVSTMNYCTTFQLMIPHPFLLKERFLIGSI